MQTTRDWRRHQPGHVFCPPDCSWEARRCPPDCSNWLNECPHRICPPKGRCIEPIESAVNRTLTVVWRHAPKPPSWQPDAPRLLLVTVTFPHRLQILKLDHCARVLASVPNILWLVAEDAARPSADVAELLRRTGRPYRHIAYGPTRKGGNAQRDMLLRVIRRERLTGIVYNMDDDNGYHPTLWTELRRLRPLRVGIIAVRRGAYPPAACDGVFDVLGPGSGWKHREHMIERPTYDEVTGSFTGFEAGWCDPGAWNWQRLGRREFCVDMGGFAFDAALLHRMSTDGPIWNYTGHGGESELVARLLPGGVPEDLQPLANCGQDVLVFHNEYRHVPVAVRRPRMRCGFDGWGVQDDIDRRERPRPPWPSVYQYVWNSADALPQVPIERTRGGTGRGWGRTGRGKRGRVAKSIF